MKKAPRRTGRSALANQTGVEPAPPPRRPGLTSAIRETVFHPDAGRVPSSIPTSSWWAVFGPGSPDQTRSRADHPSVRKSSDLVGACRAVTLGARPYETPASKVEGPSRSARTRTELVYGLPTGIQVPGRRNCPGACCCCHPASAPAHPVDRTSTGGTAPRTGPRNDWCSAPAVPLLHYQRERAVRQPNSTRVRWS